MSHQLSRLASVSRIFYDQEVLSLRKENEELTQTNNALKLALFWRQYSVSRLRNCLWAANESRNVSHSRDSVLPWLVKYLIECGLVIEKKPEIDPEDDPTNNDTRLVNIGGWFYIPTGCSIDTHLVDYGGWFYISYGPKLLHATSADDPELKKLVKLFELLAPGFANECPW